MTGGTQQTGASQTAPGGGVSQAEAQAMAERARADEAARARREQDLAVREAVLAEREKTQRAATPAPVYSGAGGSITGEGGGYTQAPAAPAPSVVPAAGGGGAVYSPTPAPVDTPDVIPEVVMEKPGINWGIFAILGALGLMAVSKKGR